MRWITDAGIVASLLLLVAWGVVTLVFGAPGWSNALLTGGVFLLILRIVVRGTPSGSGAGTGAGAAQSGGAGGSRTVANSRGR